MSDVFEGAKISYNGQLQAGEGGEIKGNLVGWKRNECVFIIILVHLQ